MIDVDEVRAFTSPTFFSEGARGLVTGTTVVNGTIEPILEVAGAKAVFYGISIAGVAELLRLERFCPRST
jgi:FtsP/CotA-like multicopper oxidase with cupredoxin domain